MVSRSSPIVSTSKHERGDCTNQDKSKELTPPSIVLTNTNFDKEACVIHNHNVDCYIPSPDNVSQTTFKTTETTPLSTSLSASSSVCSVPSREASPNNDKPLATRLSIQHDLHAEEHARLQTRARPKSSRRRPIKASFIPYDDEEAASCDADQEDSDSSEDTPHSTVLNVRTSAAIVPPTTRRRKSDAGLQCIFPANAAHQRSVHKKNDWHFRSAPAIRRQQLSSANEGICSSTEESSPDRGFHTPSKYKGKTLIKENLPFLSKRSGKFYADVPSSSLTTNIRTPIISCKRSKRGTINVLSIIFMCIISLSSLSSIYFAKQIHKDKNEFVETSTNIAQFDTNVPIRNFSQFRSELFKHGHDKTVLRRTVGGLRPLKFGQEGERKLGAINRDRGLGDLDSSFYFKPDSDDKADEEKNKYPRVVFVNNKSERPVSRYVELYPAVFSDNTQLYGVRNSDDEALSKMELRPPYSEGECVPMQEWQTKYYPSCNGMHELDLERLEDDGGSVSLFGTKGYWRNAWRVDLLGDGNNNEENDTFVLKTLKYNHNFEDAHFEHDRIDAISMERLTASPHVINIYSFCGHSVMTEFADGPRLGTLADKSKKVPLKRLQIARDIASGLADVHGIDGDGNATFVHLDINPANVVVIGKSLKLNDFNIGVVRRWNTTSNTPCNFSHEYPNAQWRSPEEARYPQILSEKVDVFSMGHIFFRLICGHEPWNKLEIGGRPSPIEVTEKVKAGILPHIPEKITNSTDLEIKAILDVMLQCYTVDPGERPSAREISNQLDKSLKSLEQEEFYLEYMEKEKKKEEKEKDKERKKKEKEEKEKEKQRRKKEKEEKERERQSKKKEKEERSNKEKRKSKDHEDLIFTDEKKNDTDPRKDLIEKKDASSDKKKSSEKRKESSKMESIIEKDKASKESGVKSKIKEDLKSTNEKKQDVASNEDLSTGKDLSKVTKEKSTEKNEKASEKDNIIEKEKASKNTNAKPLIEDLIRAETQKYIDQKNAASAENDQGSETKAKSLRSQPKKDLKTIE